MGDRLRAVELLSYRIPARDTSMPFYFFAYRENTSKSNISYSPSKGFRGSLWLLKVGLIVVGWVCARLGLSSWEERSKMSSEF